MTELDLEKLRIQKTGLQPGVRRRRRWAWAFTALVLLAAAGLAYHQGLLSPAVGVQAALVQNVYASQALTLLNASGYVVADRKSAVASKLTGRLVYLGVEEGSRVKEGQVIARLENRDALAARERAVQNVAVAFHNLEQARAELNNAALDYARKKTLVENGTIARSLYDAAEARHLSAAAVVAALESARRAAEAARAEAEVLLDYTNIRAPFDAVVLTKNADIGDIVTPLAATADAKAAVVTIADTSSLLVEVDVSESDIAKVGVGQPCEIRLDAFGDRRFPGRVHMVLPTADRSKASVAVKVAFRELDARVLPEMSAKVAFLSRAVEPGEEAPVRAVPVAAIVRRNGADVVFQIEGDRVREVPVVPDRRVGEMQGLSAGPPVGSRIATAPLERLQDGIRVSIPQP
ncbi:MAG: efflux RND transporter periplasmic adaptor subunit [Desulfobacterales bacterium]